MQEKVVMCGEIVIMADNDIMVDDFPIKDGFKYGEDRGNEIIYLEPISKIRKLHCNNNLALLPPHDCDPLNHRHYC